MYLTVLNYSSYDSIFFNLINCEGKLIEGNLNIFILFLYYFIDIVNYNYHVIHDAEGFLLEEMLTPKLLKECVLQNILVVSQPCCFDIDETLHLRNRLQHRVYSLSETEVIYSSARRICGFHAGKDCSRGCSKAPQCV